MFIIKYEWLGIKNIMFKNFFSLFSLSLIIYILSFFHQLLISYFFGTSDLLDAYWLSLAVAFMFTIHAQPVKEVLVNDYYTMEAQKNKISNRFLAQNLFFWLIFSLVKLFSHKTWKCHYTYLSLKARFGFSTFHFIHFFTLFTFHFIHFCDTFWFILEEILSFRVSSQKRKEYQ